MHGKEFRAIGARWILRILAPLLAAAVLFAAATGATAATVSGSNGPLTVSMHAGTHHPKAGRNWWITVTARQNGRTVRARAAYQFLYNGTQVGPLQYPKFNHHFTFVGSFTDNLVFPARAVGYPLTFRAIISTGRYAVYLPYSVQVIR
jgi:hypothetical protein